MTVQIMVGDCRDILRQIPERSVQMCCTSPPYFGLRDYGVVGQIGLEPTPEEFVSQLVAVFRAVRRVLKEDGTLWLNLGDSYAADTKGSSGVGEKQISNAGTLLSDRRWRVPPGLKRKDLIGIPWRVAFALQADGWYLRQDIIWSKPNPMPESVRDRCTKAHEYIFLLSKSERYFYDQKAIAEPGVGRETYFGSDVYSKGSGRNDSGSLNKVTCETRNRRSVWNITTQPFSEAHFATFPPELPEICIKAGSRPGDTVLDPFGGAGTTALVADRLGRNAIIAELNPEYAAMARRRIEGDAPLLAEVTA